jgi:hypothetical protein
MAAQRWPWHYLHHQVELHLTAGTPADLGEALRLAERDHDHARPHATAGRLLVTALRASGLAERAERLAADLEEERRRALAVLDRR